MDGKKIRRATWGPSSYWKLLQNGRIVNSKGEELNDWFVVKE